MSGWNMQSGRPAEVWKVREGGSHRCKRFGTEMWISRYYGLVDITWLQKGAHPTCQPWSLLTCFYHNLVDKWEQISFLGIFFVIKMEIFAKIYHSLLPHCLKGYQNRQHLLLFPKPSYWAQTFLSTTGTAVPIFLQPCVIVQLLCY